jgi:hypothetical protein
MCGSQFLTYYHITGQEWLTTRRACYGTSALARLIVAVSGVSPGRVGRD